MATILEFLVSILLFLDSIIYSLISWVYQIILVLCRIDILGNTNAIDELINRLYIIIGVIVLFLVAYSLLKSMVNPDDTLKNKKGPVTIIKDVLISIVLIALVPTIFQFVIGFQNALLTQNTLGKIILGTQGNSEASGVEDGGMFFASNVLSAFLHPSECPQADDGSYDCSNAKVATGSIGIPFIFSITTETTNFNEIWSELTSSGSLLGITTFAYDITHDGNVTYYYIISTVVGVFVLLVLLSYCIDVAIRVVKLAVYELIAPLPILLRIVPNEQGNKVFSNWLKACISTYLEVFIRLAILFFAVFLAKVVVDNFTTIFAPLVSGEAGWTVVLFAQMFLILGIILFIKQAPGLIKDITGLDGGKYGFFTGLKGAMQAGTMFGSGITTAVRNFNAKDENGENRSMRKRIASATAGFGSGFGRAFKSANDVKDLKSMRSNIHNSAEEAIKKRIQRENNKLNAKRERDSYIEELNQKRREAGQEEFGAVAGRLKYKAHKAGAAAAEWAGTSNYNAVAVQRTQELADKVDAGFSAIEGTWKKSQGFIDAKAEADKASNQFNAMQQAYRSMIAQGMTEDQAKANIENSWKMTLEEAEIRKNNTKALQEEIERTEQKKKAESIATAARNIQLSVAQYSDVKIDENRVLERESDIVKRAAMESAKTFYGNLDNEDNYRNLINDLQSSDREAQNRARSLLDYFDKFNLEAKYQKGEAKYQEEQRKSTIKPSDKGGSSK